jgi:hypothetical protein
MISELSPFFICCPTKLETLLHHAGKLDSEGWGRGHQAQNYCRMENQIELPGEDTRREEVVDYFILLIT